MARGPLGKVAHKPLKLQSSGWVNWKCSYERSAKNSGSPVERSVIVREAARAPFAEPALTSFRSHSCCVTPSSSARLFAGDFHRLFVLWSER